MRTIAICNQAGGVGKTTTTRDLGYELMLCGLKVFLLDADSQGSLGEYLGCHPHQRPAEEMFWSSLCNDTSEQPHVVEKYDVQVGLSNLLLAKGDEVVWGASAFSIPV
jgi:chromosome partitioning protein